MPQCCRCPTKQAKLNRGNLCTSCFNGDSDVGMIGMTNGTGSSSNNQSLFNDNSFISSQRAQNSHVLLPALGGQPQQFSSPFISGPPLQQQQFNSQQHSVGQRFPTSNVVPRPFQPTSSGAESSASGITPENLGGLLEKPISELTVADIIQINRISNSPMQQQLNSIESEMKKKIQILDNRVNVLEQRNAAIEEENTVLRDTISNMQKSLNRVDSEVRNKNVVITGLPEGEIPGGDGDHALTTDDEKIDWILRVTENTYFNNRTENFRATRLGEPKPGYNRVVKIVMSSVDERDEFLKNAIKMKDAPPPWNKVYIKKDQHPVYLGENNRLRKKVNDLKKKPGYENKEIKLVNGKVLVDNQVVDKNLFFR